MLMKSVSIWSKRPRVAGLNLPYDFSVSSALDDVEVVCGECCLMAVAVEGCDGEWLCVSSVCEEEIVEHVEFTLCCFPFACLLCVCKCRGGTQYGGRPTC